MQSNDVDTRNKKIVEAYTGNGLVSLEAVGKQFGLTRERVRQIIKKTSNLKPEEKSAMRKADALRRHLQAAEKAMENDEDVRTVEALSEKSGVPYHFIMKYPAEFDHIIDVISKRLRHDRLTMDRPSHEQFSNDDISKALVRISKKLGGAPVTVPLYREHVKAGEPSLSLIVIRYENLIEACQVAGVPHSKERPKRPIFTKDDIKTSILKCYKELGYESLDWLSFSEYSKWARATGHASGALVRKTFGSWKNAKRNALQS